MTERSARYAVGPLAPQPLWLTALKATGVVMACALLVRLAWRLVVTLAVQGADWTVPVALMVGYAGADLLSGSVHWFCDTFFTPRTPLIGRIVILPFRDHHDHPQRIVQYRFLEQDTTNFFLMLLPLGWLWASDLPSPTSPRALFGAALLFAFCCGSFLTNLFHKWAHDPAAPRAVRFLQGTGLILAPERHWIHHRDHSRGFCVTSGWMNRLLDPIHFFPRLERGVRVLRSPTSARRDFEAERR